MGHKRRADVRGGQLARKEVERSTRKRAELIERSHLALGVALPRSPRRARDVEPERSVAWFRDQCTDEQNRALDLWAKGVKGPTISQLLGHDKNATVAAHWIPRARKRGDPRAIVRLPDRIGVRHPWRKRRR